MWGNEIIQQVYRWRVVSGNEVRVLEGPWLPHPISFKIYDKPHLLEILYVIDSKRYLNGDDAALIHSIPSGG
ncbi:hypothetical protein G4B88_027510 [Cannabis sativa]|uniref:Uncharacterized protein n=1 Tax=Cannabis sativa TaxID=3483 RepID=A0A7J6E0V4_CANSA|nr:hypothetical protein G4B88_027510 [Cannabis sativa]